MQSLTGQVAVVTGGARGIGFGVAAVLRSEGANVVIADADAAAANAAATELGAVTQAVAVETNVTDRDSVEASVAEATSRWGQLGYGHYGASKAAMLGLMRSAALEVARHGITVNAILPGNIRTPGFGDLGPGHEQRMLAAIPLGVLGEPADVGWAVRFLASPEARYITGQTLIIDGGQTLPESASPAPGTD